MRIKYNELKCKTVHKNHSVSVVIPTCDREKSLKLLLDSILQQTKLPKEVIIVDDGDDFKTHDLTKQQRKCFSDKGIRLKYLRNLKEKSVSIVRNFGAMQAKEEIILFLDDDIILDKQYIEKILEVYKTYPNAIGVQGLITNVPMSSKLLNILNKIFFGNHLEKSQCRILPSGYTTYPYPKLSKVINCQWFSGCNQSYRRGIFKIQRFDENLKRLSSGEDMDFSYKIFKKHPNSLYLTPNAKLLHNYSLTSLPDHLLIYNRTINGFYFFYKNIEQTLLNKLIFIWCNIGRVAVNVSLRLHTTLKKEKPKWFKMKYLREIKCLVESYIYSIKHLKEIKTGHLEFFQDMLFQNEKQTQRTCATKR